MPTAKFYNSKEGAPIPNKPNHIGAVGLIIQQNKVLLERRRDSMKWSFIGGGLLINESLEECVIRETLEETSLIVKSLQFLKIFSNPYRIVEYPDGNILRIITVLYKVIVEISPLVCSEESIELKFFSKEELVNLDIAETHRDILNFYLENC
jgi:8-oxo-dGTP pyrophosphatase MutT (NUDIX family)